MPERPTHGAIHTGDVSGTFVVGDGNRVTTTTRPPEQPADPEQPAHPEHPDLPQQHSAAEDQAAVFAVGHGDLHVTYNAAPRPEAGAEAGTEPEEG